MKTSDGKPVQPPPGGKTIELKRPCEDAAKGQAETDARGGSGPSRESHDIQTIKELLRTMPDSRKEKIALLKKKIASGEYDVDTRKVADKMIREFLLEEVLKT